LAVIKAAFFLTEEPNRATIAASGAGCNTHSPRIQPWGANTTMNRPRRALFPVICLSCGLSVAAQITASQPTAPPLNPLKVALLKWYRANRTTSFAVGNQPYGVAFDGENIWTANLGDNTVTKLRAADGTVLGTFTVGSQPIGATFLSNKDFPRALLSSVVYCIDLIPSGSIPYETCQPILRPSSRNL
jgi:hypothetical protein